MVIAGSRECRNRTRQISSMKRSWRVPRYASGGALLVLGASISSILSHLAPAVDEADLLRAKQRIETLHAVNDSLRAELDQLREELTQRHCPEAPRVAVGQRLPEFHAAGWLNGNSSSSLTELKGKVVVVDIWAFW